MQKKESTAIHFGNQQFVLEQLERYLRDPNEVSGEWIAFFHGMEFASGAGEEGPSEEPIERYKRYGHLLAKINPIKDPPTQIAELNPTDARLRAIYTGTTSYETMHLENKELEKWFHEEVQKGEELTKGDWELIVREFWKAKHLEEYLQKKFLGAKRFSLEGGESFMPMLNQICIMAVNAGYQAGAIGMAHRGRLNVLCNLLSKPYKELFCEFNTKLMPPMTNHLGDVKYHKGYNAKFQGMELILMPNPSHLESVDPVVLGFVKGRGGKVLPITIHGDASVAGQGVVYETLQFVNLKGYETRGTVHIVINNQVGFTAIPEETRSTRYCTDIAKGFGIPVIHVNADDPAACFRAAKLAFNVRDRFGSDVFIDLNCCRHYGHNEGDEPRFTNPLLYQKIASRGDVYENLKKESGLSSDWIKQMESAFDTELEKAFAETPTCMTFPESKPLEPLVTATPVKHLLERITEIPKDFSAHPKIVKLFEARRKGERIDWATGELLAYASLLEQKIPVRLSGEDSKRGTFSHRHAVLFDQTSEKSYISLDHISGDQATFQVYNSPLSEFAVMGFEFGYSMGDPKALVIWEGQFGDFVNGAQIIIDQYLAGCETKWGVHSGLTLFLPHGYEGMGPEHTSCRLERFLELSALNNWRVVYPSTPAQFFHILRDQALQVVKKPLIIPTPKSMLRLPESFSDISELTKGGFQSVIYDPIPNPKKVVLCTGKLYHELKAARGDKPIALVRVEQLYPFPELNLPNAPLIWAQEEPENQGAWSYVKEAISEKFQVRYVGRKRIPVPDTGSAARFHYEQQEIIQEALYLE